MYSSNATYKYIGQLSTLLPQKLSAMFWSNFQNPENICICLIFCSLDIYHNLLWEVTWIAALSNLTISLSWVFSFFFFLHFFFHHGVTIKTSVFWEYVLRHFLWVITFMNNVSTMSLQMLVVMYQVFKNAFVPAESHDSCSTVSGFW